MILHDETFEDLAKAPIKTVDVEVVRQIDPDDTTPLPALTWSSSDVLMSVNIDVVGNFLGTATKKAVVKLLGTDHTDVPLDIPFSGDVFKINLGLFDQDPSVAGFNYISEGVYIIDTVDVNYDDGFTTVTMYDHMWTAQNTLYTDTAGSSGFTFPSTIEEFAGQMAAAIGVDLMADFDDLPNSDYSITIDPYANISNANLQMVIAEIAAATGTTARITDTTLIFSPYTVNDENLNSVNLKTLKIGKTFGPVTSVIFGRRPQNDNIVISTISPENNAVSAVNTTTNLLTVTGHTMVNGNLVRLEATGSLPAPLLANTNYFVRVNDANTFKLAPTHADAIAETNLIDITTTGSGVTLEHLQTQEVQINNNQIVDDDRESLLTPVYAKLIGIEWNEMKSQTTGLGYFEVGDVIQFTQGSRTVKTFIDEIHIELIGSVKESLVATIPDVATINYQTAGGIIKTVYNTEIKVDKQANEITSIVSQQDIYQTEVDNNFTEIYQNLDKIVLTVQKSGGGNLIRNSVGLATTTTNDNGGDSYQKFDSWEYNASYDKDTHGTVTSSSSSESQNHGGVSGQAVRMAGASLKLTQRVNVAVATDLSFALRVKNSPGTGEATITLSNTNDTDIPPIVIDDLTNYDWSELKIEDFETTLPWLDIVIEIDDATNFIFTDLRLLYGSSVTSWVQSPFELLATNVQFTELGMKIFDNVHDTETQVTYNEFSTRRRSDGVILFEADDTGVVTNDLGIKGKTRYYAAGEEVIRQITIPNSSDLAGIAWIAVT